MLSNWDLRTPGFPPHIVTDKGSNIRKAVLEMPGVTSIVCFSHVLQRAICQMWEEVGNGSAMKKVAQLGSYLHRSEAIHSKFVRF